MLIDRQCIVMDLIQVIVESHNIRVIDRGPKESSIATLIYAIAGWVWYGTLGVVAGIVFSLVVFIHKEPAFKPAMHFIKEDMTELEQTALYQFVYPYFRSLEFYDVTTGFCEYRQKVVDVRKLDPVVEVVIVYLRNRMRCQVIDMRQRRSV